MSTQVWVWLAVAASLGGLIGALIRDLDAHADERRLTHLAEMARRDRDHHIAQGQQMWDELDRMTRIAAERLSLLHRRDEQIALLHQQLHHAELGIPPARPPAARAQALDSTVADLTVALADPAEAQTAALPLYDDVVRRRS